MAVISVKELFQKRRSSVKDGKTSHTRAWSVVCDDIADGTAVALRAEGIPEDGDPFPGDAACTVSSLAADPISNSDRHFEVTAEYTEDDETFGIPANPVDRIAEVSWDSAEATNAYFLDRSEPPKPVVNSAGDPFANDLTREEGEPVITIVVNEAEHDALAADEFSHTINLEAVKIETTTFAPGTLKLSPIKAQKVKERIEDNGVYEDVTYYKRTYLLKARKGGWLDKPLDVGFNEKIGDLSIGFKLRPILDATNNPIRTAQPLNGSGRLATIATPNQPVQLEFKPYKQVAWTSLKPFTPGYWDEGQDDDGGTP